MARIEHNGFDASGVRNPARPQHRLDHFAHVHDRNEVFVVVENDRKIGEESHAIDVELTGAGGRANAAAITAQRNGPVDACVIGNASPEWNHLA